MSDCPPYTPFPNPQGCYPPMCGDLDRLAARFGVFPEDEGRLMGRARRVVDEGDVEPRVGPNCCCGPCGCVSPRHRLKHTTIDEGMII